MRTLVCGSRTIDDGPLIFKALDALDPPATRIISGMARGPDKITAAWAKHRGVLVEEYPARWDELGRSAGFQRNIQMLEVSARVIAFWDGESRGTRHTISEARKRNLPLVLYQPFGGGQLIISMGDVG